MSTYTPAYPGPVPPPPIPPRPTSGYFVRRDSAPVAGSTPSYRPNGGFAPSPGIAQTPNRVQYAGHGDESYQFPQQSYENHPPANGNQMYHDTAPYSPPSSQPYGHAQNQLQYSQQYEPFAPQRLSQSFDVQKDNGAWVYQSNSSINTRRKSQQFPSAPQSLPSQQHISNMQGARRQPPIPSPPIQSPMSSASTYVSDVQPPHTRPQSQYRTDEYASSAFLKGDQADLIGLLEFSTSFEQSSISSNVSLQNQSVPARRSPPAHRPLPPSPPANHQPLSSAISNLHSSSPQAQAHSNLQSPTEMIQVSPSSSPTNPVDEETSFYEASVERFRQVLHQERFLIQEGKAVQVLSLLQDFVDNEVIFRRERYGIPKEIRLASGVRKVSVSSPPPVRVEMARRTSKETVNHTGSSPSSEQQVDEDSPPSTFAAILSKTISPPLPMPTSPIPPRRAPPPIPEQEEFEPERQTGQCELEAEQYEFEEPTTDLAPSTLEPTVQVIPKSDALEQVLLSLPKPDTNDPSLIPLRAHLTDLKDLEWVKAEQLAFDAHEPAQLSPSPTPQNQSPNPTNPLETRRPSHTKQAQSLARWRSQYCDPTYEKLHAKFTSIANLHHTITEVDDCQNYEEHVSLLNDVQDTFFDIMGRLDVLTDELRRRQHLLYISRVTNGEEGQIEEEKEREDAGLKEQRNEFKLEKMRLHAQCVKYIIDYGVEVLQHQSDMVKAEIEKILPPEDASPSEELTEQLRESWEVVSYLHHRVNALFSLLEENESELRSEEMDLALAKMSDVNDSEAAEKLCVELTAQQRDIVELNEVRREFRDSAFRDFSELLMRFVEDLDVAENGD